MTMDISTIQDEAYKAYKQGYEAGVKSVTDNNVGDKMTPTGKDTSVLTKADRIRAMSDIDLAEFLCSITDCYDGKCPAAEYCRKGHNGMREYLKQRAEEE